MFIDVNSIDCGDDFPKEIDQAIRAAKAVIIVIGSDWLETINERADQPETDFVRRETSIALKRKMAGDAEIFPVLVGQTVIPQINDLHDSLKTEIGKLFDYQVCEFPAEIKLWDLQFDRLRKLLASVEGVPQSSAQLPYSEGQLTFQSSDTKPLMRPVQLNVQAVQQAFGFVSSALLNWPQEIDGQWIERSELDQLYALVVSNQSSAAILLGEPGVGKSAILARLGSRLIEEGVLLLAIKADQLPRSMSILRDLDDWIGCDVPVTEALHRLASENRVVVLIDQLDALSELMDQHTERLGLVIRFVNTIRNVPNLSVLVSCREFEFHYDVRFNSLNAEEVSLAYPRWESVQPILTARGFNTSSWSEEVRNVLSTPQHLAMFLHHLADENDEPLYSTYQSLLARIIEKRLKNVHGERTVEVAERIAATMAIEEELWVGRGKFESEFSDELQRLEESGFLIQSENRLSVSFRHQTVFDFLHARAFLRDGQPLAKYIVEQKRQSLFVRPSLWSTLNYLRASDKAVYRKQFDELWTNGDLRPHIRNLLVNFLGQVKNPDDQEALWLFSRLEKQSFRPNVFQAIAGSRGWFNRILSRVPTYMSAKPEEAEQVTEILARAASFEPDNVLKLVEKYWLTDDEYVHHALIVMQEFSIWDEHSVEVVCKLADQTPINTHLIQNAAKRISKSRADLAPRVISRYLQAKTRQIDHDKHSQHTQAASASSDSEQVEQLRSVGDELRPYELLIDNNTSWYGIEEITRRAPKAFIQELWSWFVELFDRLGRKENPYLCRYRDHHSLAFKRDESDDQSLQTAMEIAIRGYAETNIKGFLNFLEENKNSDLIVVHQLLSLGLERIARQESTAVLNYLLEDPRRFAIGDIFNENSDTQALISAVVPSLRNEEALRLEMSIREWKCYRKTPDGEGASTRFYRLKEIRMSRLKLLRVFPFERLSPEGQHLLREEERAFPAIPTKIVSIEGGRIISPMSSEQMENANDEQILALFEELTDDTGWDHPTRRWTNFVGGSIEASREFAEFSRKAPHRAFHLIRKFQAGKTERPAGAALYELSKGTMESADLIACIHELDKRGFASEHFRTNIARCLGEIAIRDRGLDYDTCNLLEKWISDWEPKTEAATVDWLSNNFGATGNRGIHQRVNQQSLLWGLRDSRIVPEGNYAFLDALMRGYLAQSSRAVDQWLGVLERHLERNENPAVWREIAENLWRLADADRARATKFFASFFSLCRDILHTDTGVLLIARIMLWLPNQMISNIINNWISGSWLCGPQAAGEILALRLCYDPENTITQTNVEQILSRNEYDPSVLDALQVGVTYTFVTVWSEPPLRALATKYLVQLIAMESEAVEKALIGSFAKLDSLLADDHTKDFLEALLEKPKILIDGGHFLIKGLKSLLRDGWRPHLVYRVTRILISENAGDLGDTGTSWAFYAGDFADIALTLHRIPDTCELGLELFESLIEARSYGIDERILKLDRMAFK